MLRHLSGLPGGFAAYSDIRGSEPCCGSRCGVEAVLGHAICEDALGDPRHIMRLGFGPCSYSSEPRE